MPVTDVDLVLVAVSVVAKVLAGVLAGVLGPALAGAEDPGEALAGVEPTLHGEDGNISVQADRWTFLPVTLN